MARLSDLITQDEISAMHVAASKRKAPRGRAKKSKGTYMVYINKRLVRVHQ